MKPLSILVALLGTTNAALAANPDFYRDVYPFLKANCISCHNKTTTKADLDMETPEMMMKGGESGPAIIAGKSAESLIVQASLHQSDMEMPPANNKSGAVNLTPAEIAVLKTWIDQGAKSSVQEQREVAWQPLAAGVHPIYSVAMTKDGRYAACGRSNQVFIYDLGTRQFITQVVDETQKPGTAHKALVQSLAFSPDGKRMASGSFREVKIWRLEPGKPATEVPASPPAPVDAALIQKISTAGKVTVLAQALSADGKQLATGCADGSVRLWDVTTSKQLMELRGSVSASQTMTALDWTVASAGLDQAFQKTEVTRIEAQNKALDELLKKANEAIVAMKKVLPEKQKALQPTQEAKAKAQKVVDDAAAQLAKAVDAAAKVPLEKALKDAQEKLLGTAMTETSAQAGVAAAESNIKDAEDDVKRISDSKASNAKALTAANAAIETAKKTQEKATADLATTKQTLAKPTTKALALAFSTDAQRVAAVLSDGSLQVWAVATGMPVEQIPGTATASATLASTPSGAFVAKTAEGKVIGTASAPRWVLERVLGGDKQQAVFADRVNAVRFSPDGKTLATGGGEPSRSGDVHLFDVATGKLLKTWKERHEDAVLCLDFSPNGKLLASGAADKIARVIDVATGKQVNLLEGHTHHVMGIAFRADGRVLATAGADGVVISWNMILGERKKKIEGWTKEVTSLQFIGATNQIVTSAGDNLVRIVNDDGAEIRAIAKLPDFMQAAASTPNGTTIIGGGEDSVLRVWDGTNGKEVVAFGAK